MIDEAALRQAFADLQRRVAYLEKAMGLFVSDDALDMPGGDKRVKFVPRDWKGENVKGRFYSECSPEFLEVLAETLTWMADNPQEGKEKYAAFNRKDAARARSWARRLRAREAAKTSAPNGGQPDRAAASERAEDNPSVTAGETAPFDPETGEVFDAEDPGLAGEDEHLFDESDLFDEQRAP